MDIICAKCGKHFSSIEGAREHSGHCKETSKGEPIRWIPTPKSKIPPEEWESLIKLINRHDFSPPKEQPEEKARRKAEEEKKAREPAEADVSMPITNSKKNKRIPDKYELSLRLLARGSQ